MKKNIFGVSAVLVATLSVLSSRQSMADFAATPGITRMEILAGQLTQNVHQAQIEAQRLTDSGSAPEQAALEDLFALESNARGLEAALAQGLDGHSALILVEEDHLQVKQSFVRLPAAYTLVASVEKIDQTLEGLRSEMGAADVDALPNPANTSKRLLQVAKQAQELVLSEARASQNTGIVPPPVGSQRAIEDPVLHRAVTEVHSVAVAAKKLDDELARSSADPARLRANLYEVKRSLSVASLAIRRVGFSSQLGDLVAQAQQLNQRIEIELLPTLGEPQGDDANFPGPHVPGKPNAPAIKTL